MVVLRVGTIYWITQHDDDARGGQELVRTHWSARIPQVVRRGIA
jgi:hypothetical protein